MTPDILPVANYGRIVSAMRNPALGDVLRPSVALIRATQARY